MEKNKQKGMAERRYRETLEHYLSEVQQDPALTLKAYCRMKHVYHGGMLEWMRKEGMAMPGRKAGAVSEGCLFPEDGYSGNVFIQIYPEGYLRSLQKDGR